MPTLELERLVAVGPLRYIAGVDEAGRGALAGPVVAAAVLLPLEAPERLAALAEVDDSKRLTPCQRERLYSLIITHALAYGLGVTPADMIDTLGILPATYQAMRDALRQLSPAPDWVLVDGLWPIPDWPGRQQAVVRGDQHSLSIAAASILAKVTRDRYMHDQAHRYPAYGFERHKGYATPHHLAALQRYGPSPEHRCSFAPLATATQQPPLWSAET